MARSGFRSPSFFQAHRWQLAALGVAVILLAAALLFVLHRRSASRSTAAQSGYVDPAVCARCHGDVVATYSKTGMGRSFSHPSSQTMQGDFTTHNTLCNQASGLCYTMFERDGQYYERRYEIGFDGHPANIVEERVDYIIGSGNHARTFLHRNTAGNLIELPVSWYSEKSGYWAMSPGYDRADQEDFRRAIPQECMFCHNAYPAAGETPAQIDGEKAVFGPHLPEGIDCQRCHGPGAAHVAAADSPDSTLAKIRAAIVNPAHLSRDRQLEVCMQCHLETSSRNMPNELRLFGRSVFSYRPGQPLSDYKLYFHQVPSSKSGEVFEIAHQAYRLRMSACFRNSQMTCLTCHNPHNVTHGEEAAEHYQKICLGCHQNVAHKVSLPAASHCVDCHMPKRRTEDAVHVVMTDHYIQRLLPKGDLLAPLPEQIDTYVPGSKVALYYPPQLPQTPQNDLLLATAKISSPHPAPSDIADLEALLDRSPSAQPEPWLELGRAYAKIGNHQDAIRCFDHLLQQNPDYLPALQELTVALFATGQQQRAADLLEKAVARHPSNALLLTNLGNASLQLGDIPRAQQLLTRALQLDPENAEAENLLGLASLRSGDRTQAEKSFREAIRFNPRDAGAQNNLGNLLTSPQNLTEAEYHFQRAIAIDPAYSEAHHGYGLLLIFAHKYPQALDQLQTAVRLDPHSTSALSDLGDLLSAQGRLPEAAAIYRQLLALAPDQLEARLGLGLALLRENKPSQALPELERAASSSDPAVAGAAVSALRQMAR
ncbi:tetratricopeptide repeat protein [Paracidobacterium acidisoli]|uniref:Tetratricopeptide repeat protein n=1 Tax=Paracidobacterium acidisoli TaxID=2303751 RepID=A0A372ISW6_9BACT|nr:tetratricopeptide repeat protein [Paracidobacterium acidisoli]MBT9330820.1 tetratricopeptide repeat protein [Paracidobacterium acidisoli]